MSLGISYAGYRTGFPFPVSYNAELWDGYTFGDDDLPAATDPSKWPVGPGTLHPLGLTFKQACEYCWRIREWSYEADVTLTHESSYEGVIYTGAASFTARTMSLNPAYGPWDEAAMCRLDVVNWERFFGLGGSDYENIGGYSSVEPPFTDPPNDLAWNSGNIFIVLEFLRLGRPSIEFYFLEGLYYPNLTMDLSLRWTSAPTPFGDAPGETSTFGFRANGGSIPSMETGLLLDFNGWGTIPVYSVDALSATGYCTLDGTMTMAPSIYWGYGGKFNPATGARL